MDIVSAAFLEICPCESSATIVVHNPKRTTFPFFSKDTAMWLVRELAKLNLIDELEKRAIIDQIEASKLAPTLNGADRPFFEGETFTEVDGCEDAESCMSSRALANWRAARSFLN
jgi:hypothetical protein